MKKLAKVEKKHFKVFWSFDSEDHNDSEGCDIKSFLEDVFGVESISLDWSGEVYVEFEVDKDNFYPYKTIEYVHNSLMLGQVDSNYLWLVFWLLRNKNLIEDGIYRVNF